jgi:hypothetical protein
MKTTEPLPFGMRFLEEPYPASLAKNRLTWKPVADAKLSLIPYGTTIGGTTGTGQDAKGDERRDEC